MKSILLILTLLVLSNTSHANIEAPVGSDKFKFEINANAYKNGETLEIGLVSPWQFKLKESSRHHWGFFATLGLNTVSNVLLTGQTNVEEEINNLEVIAGLMAQAQFFKSHITQYGKIAVDYIKFDDDIDDSAHVGGLLETGLAFHSLFSDDDEVSGSSLHIGLRWRAAFDTVDNLPSQPDLVEGISFVFGSRITF